MTQHARLLLALSVTIGLTVAATLPSCVSNSSNPEGADSGGFTFDSGIPTFDSASPSEDAGAHDATVPVDAAVDANPITEDSAPSTEDANPGTEDASQPDAADAAVAEDAGQPASITSFTVTPNVIPAGAARTVTLSWTVANATSLSISGIGTVTGTSTTTSISAATTFTLTATGATGSPATAMASVTVAPSIYIDAVNGHDATPGDGTAAHPYQTVAKAGSVAIAGQTIYVAAGSYTLATAAVTLANNVGVEALTYGTVTFAPASGNSYGLTFTGSGFVHGIHLSSAFVNVSAGTVTLDGVQFANIADSGTTGASGINASGTGHVIVTPGGLTNYLGAAVASYADIYGAAQLEIHGGALDNAARNVFDGSALISAQGTSQLLLDGVTIDSALTSAIVTGASPTVTIQNGSLIHASAGTGGSAWSLNINNGGPTWVIDGSTISASPKTGMYINGGSTPNITFRNGAVLEGSTGDGIYFQGSTATLTLDGATISGNGSAGVRMGAGVYTVTMRDTQITGNTNDGFIAYLNAGSTLDLGNATTAGGNTFTGNAASVATSSNLNFSTELTTADIIVGAIGNTWDPTANGADGGVFPAGTVFSAPPSVTGKNVQLAQAGTATYHLEVLASP